jgi:hypothetical protein
MIDLSPGARAILDEGRDLDGAGDLERARVRRALFAKIAAGGITALAASTAAADAAAAGSAAAGSAAAGSAAAGSAAAGSAAAGSSAAVALPLAKILVPLVMVIAGSVGGTLAWRAQRQTTPVPVASAPAAIAAAPALIVPAPAPTTAPPGRLAAPAHRVHVAARVSDEAPANRLAEEMALLAASNAELRGGDARQALALLNDYDRRYPSGVLREEVLATRVIARCQIGLAPNAASRRDADAFLTRHPASPLAPRVRSSCAR